jgi:hypothetical protein
MGLYTNAVCIYISLLYLMDTVRASTRHHRAPAYLPTRVFVFLPRLPNATRDPPPMAPFLPKCCRVPHQRRPSFPGSQLRAPRAPLAVTVMPPFLPRQPATSAPPPTPPPSLPPTKLAPDLPPPNQNARSAASSALRAPRQSSQ